MTTQWVRDILIPTPTTYDTMGNHPEMNTILFHFLRVCGWSWVWECDGLNSNNDPKHITDGSMEAVDTSSFSAITAAVLAKDTSTKHMGTQSLKVTADTDDGVQMVTTGLANTRTYQLVLWARNPSGVTWDVRCNHGGSQVSIGTIPAVDSWARYRFTFTTSVAGQYTIQVVNNNGSGGEYIYLDSIFCFQSWWEYNAAVTASGAQCALSSTNTFDVSADYTVQAGDIGSYFFVYDPVNNKNSGCYKITSTTEVDLRSSSAAFVGATGLTWRIVDVIGGSPSDGYNDVAQKSCGFMLESPHTSKWRFMLRQNIAIGQNEKCSQVWSAPLDTEFNVETGMFYKTGPSTVRTKQEDSFYLWNSNTAIGNRHAWRGPYSYFNGIFETRSFIKLDNSGSYFVFFHYDGRGGCHGCGLAGYLGANAVHPGTQEFGFFFRWGTQGAAAEQFHDSSSARYASYGTVFGPEGLTRDASIMVASYGGTSEFETQSNAQSNPWDSEEWICPLAIERDPQGVEGDPSERTVNIGVYHGRDNMNAITTFDANRYIHLASGVVWEWMEESLV